MSDVPVHLELGPVVLAALTGTFAEDSSQTFLRTCGLCLRNGLASIYSDRALTLWSAQDWSIRLRGWTASLGSVSALALRSQAVYIDAISDTDNHIQLFWLAMDCLDVRDVHKLLALVGVQASLAQLLLPGMRVSLRILPPHALALLSADQAEIMIIRDASLASSTAGVSVPRYSSLRIMRSKLHALLHK